MVFSFAVVDLAAELQSRCECISHSMESGRHPRHLGAAQWRVGTATFSIQGEGSLCAVGFILFVPFAYQMYRCLELREKVDAIFYFFRISIF